MGEKRLIKFIAFPIVILLLLFVITNFDRLQRYLAAQSLVTLGFLIFMAFLGLTTTPILYRRIRILFASAGKRKPLSEKECRKLALNYIKNNVMAQGVMERDLNIIAQRLDGLGFDNPYAYFVVTTEQFPGTKKVRMEEIHHDKLFPVYIDRLTGDITYEPTIDTEKDADLLLKDLRLHSLSYDKTKKLSELEQLVKEEEAKGFAHEKGKEVAQGEKK